MCGIAGLWNLRGDAPASPEVLHAMCQAMVHRGPDDQGVQTFGPFGMGMRRLSIIDLADGHQPMSNEDGSVAVVLNGEIYNYVELREGLEKAGHRFRTHSDTEVLVHLYEDLGVDMFSRLRGMYAFAIWDAREDRLLLGRDPAGKKPLYLYEHDGVFAFASELKCLRRVPGFAGDIDASALSAYLNLGYVPDPLSIHTRVRKLPPGHYLLRAAEGQTQARHWSLPVPRERPVRLRETCEQLKRDLRESVRIRMRADVPVGAFLSGGLDSSLVVALMKSIVPEVHTYAIGFEDEDFNELPYARRVAEHLGTRHQEWIVRTDVAKDFERILTHFDEPFADSSAIPTWYVCQMAARHVKVALTGDGGDEVFGGYLPYRMARLLGWARVCPPPALRLSQAVTGRLFPESPSFDSLGRRLRRLHRGALRPPLEAHADIMSWQPRETADALLGRPAPEGPGILAEAYRRSPGSDTVMRLMQTDFQTYLAGDILAKTDRMSMMHGLELRSPLLDRTLVDSMFALPGNLHVGPGGGKRLLKRVAKDLLPPEILRRPKHGFMIPVGRWMRGELREATHDLLLGAASRTHSLLSADVIRKLAAEHDQGRHDRTHELWNLLCLEVWLRSANP